MHPVKCDWNITAFCSSNWAISNLARNDKNKGTKTYLLLLLLTLHPHLLYVAFKVGNIRTLLSQGISKVLCTIYMYLYIENILFFDILLCIGLYTSWPYAESWCTLLFSAKIFQQRSVWSFWSKHSNEANVHLVRSWMAFSSFFSWLYHPCLFISLQSSLTVARHW